MSRTCARPGCDRAAVATLSYNYADRVVWVDDLAAEAHPMIHDLCEHHAEGLRIPRGWERRDGRTATRLGVDGGRPTAGSADRSHDHGIGQLDLRLPLKSA